MLEGLSGPQTIKLLGLIRKHPMVILIDLGANHNFILSNLVAKLA